MAKLHNFFGRRGLPPVALAFVFNSPLPYLQLTTTKVAIPSRAPIGPPDPLRTALHRLTRPCTRRRVASLTGVVALPATEVEAACAPTCKLVARKGLFALISALAFFILHTLFIWNIYSSGAD